ncbi:MAG: hypothetical protein RR256_05055, partial [Bacteroidales bacterium]
GHNLSSHISRVKKMTAYKGAAPTYKEPVLERTPSSKPTSLPKTPSATYPSGSKPVSPKSRASLPATTKPAPATYFPKGNIRTRTQVIGNETRGHRGL